MKSNVNPTGAKQVGWRRRVVTYFAIILGAYLMVAYLLLPLAWSRYAHRHPQFDDDPRLTKTHDGHPGDPLNVALVGTEAQVKEIMAKANSFPADPLGLDSDLKIAADTVLKRSYDDAPVSSLYLFGRKEDLAFEQPVDGSPRQRNHVRFWQTSDAATDAGPLWIGSASYDKRVGISETTGQITHHIAADVDTERDRLFHDLEQTKLLAESYAVPGFHQTLEGRNGGGDRWHTDGALRVGIIASQESQSQTGR